MTDQLGVNTNVVIEEAARLESAGYQGNAAPVPHDQEEEL